MIFFNNTNNPNEESFKDTKVLHILKPDIPFNELNSYYKKIANKYGTPIIYEEDPLTGKISPNQWTKIEYKKGEEENSYKHSNHSQPLHTDYGYFSFEIYCSFFYCEKQASFGGATTFIDVDTIVEILKENNPLLFNDLKKTLIEFGREDNPIAQNTDYILKQDEIGWKINWNYYRALKDKKNENLIESFKNFLDTYIEKSGELLELKLKPGEAVFFQDRRVLHGRNSFIGERKLNKASIAVNIPEKIKELIK